MPNASFPILSCYFLPFVFPLIILLVASLKYDSVIGLIWRKMRCNGWHDQPELVGHEIMLYGSESGNAVIADYFSYYLLNNELHFRVKMKSPKQCVCLLYTLRFGLIVILFIVILSRVFDLLRCTGSYRMLGLCFHCHNLTTTTAKPLKQTKL